MAILRGEPIKAEPTDDNIFARSGQKMKLPPKVTKKPSPQPPPQLQAFSGDLNDNIYFGSPGMTSVVEEVSARSFPRDPSPPSRSPPIPLKVYPPPPSLRTWLLTEGLRISLMPFLVPLIFSPFNSQRLIRFPPCGLLKMTLRAWSSCCHPSKTSSSISMLSSDAHSSALSLMCLTSVRTTKSDGFWKTWSTMRPSTPTCSLCFSPP